MTFIIILFSIFPLYVWWVKRWSYLQVIAGGSFFLLSASFLFPTLSILGLGFGLILLPFRSEESMHAHRADRFSNKWIRHPLEAFLVWGVYGFFKILPPKIASNFGAIVGRFIGTKLKSRTKLALKNLNYVLPNLKKEHSEIVTKMWENFGRVIGETPHLQKIIKNNHVKIEGLQHLKKLKNKQFLIANSHLNSIGFVALPFKLADQETKVFFRAPNNPLTFPILKKSFGEGISEFTLLPKGREGMLGALKSLKEKVPIPVSITSDLYIDSGEDINFMGKPAKTSIALVKLASKFKCPILPIQVIREENINHRVIVHPPFFVEKSDEKSLLKAMQKLNDIIGSWIKEHPEQWFWINNRW
ncbi:MAG: lysophospholipid acyltransferase family protein, partial [Alphaproteobacteria bacterium]